MILGPVSYLDCIVFCIFLAPQLIIHVGLVDTVLCVLQTLPFLLFRLPFGFIHDRFVASPEEQSPFVRQASPFEDFVIRCVRYSFANVPAPIGRVFFSREVALPFFRFRMLRHGFLRSPVHWREHREKNFKGVWIISDPAKRPDVVIYYAHGGGFKMGSSYFYLEYLVTWQSLLKEAGYQNPAVFALEYTLVPDASFPTQVREAVYGYEHILSLAEDPSIVVLAGDSAGAAIALSLMLHIGRERPDKGSLVGKNSSNNNSNDNHGTKRLEKPGMAVLISPWSTLISPLHRNTESDFLDTETLHEFGMAYCGREHSIDDPMVSPGSCRDPLWWRRACPSRGGVLVTYGEEEVFAVEAKRLAKTLEDAGVEVNSMGEAAGIHAWPVASLFLSSSGPKRLKGLKGIVEGIRKKIR